MLEVIESDFARLEADTKEVVERDFSGTLAKVETEEADAASEYEKTTQENKVSKTMMDQDVKYKSQEAVSLDKAVAELTSDKDTTSTELNAVLELQIWVLGSPLKPVGPCTLWPICCWTL